MLMQMLMTADHWVSVVSVVLGVAVVIVVWVR